MSRDKLTLENPQSHTGTAGGGAAAAARLSAEPPSSHDPSITMETPVTTAEPRATLDAEPVASHTQNDGGGS
jgi:hypothetical protein